MPVGRYSLRSEGAFPCTRLTEWLPSIFFTKFACSKLEANRKQNYICKTKFNCSPRTADQIVSVKPIHTVRSASSEGSMSIQVNELNLSPSFYQHSHRVQHCKKRNTYIAEYCKPHTGDACRSECHNRRFYAERKGDVLVDNAERPF